MSDSRELLWLRRTRDLSQMLGSEEDLTRLPALILKAAAELTGAHRAFLVSVEGSDDAQRLNVLAASGFKADALAGPEGAVSRTVVSRTLEDGGRAVITSRTADADLLAVSSIAGRGVLSVVSVPMRLRGRLLGVLYLDHLGETELFRESDLPTLQTFATQATLSLELARAQAAPPTPPQELIALSPAMQALMGEVGRVARTREPVLICGEAGVGKTVAAREVHTRSPDSADPFVVVSCGAPAAEVTRSLLGERDAPGPLGQRCTLCLEDLDALDSTLQRILALALRDGRFFVPGSAQEVTVQARLIAVSAANLADLISAGSFRSDLYYRLDVQRLVVPPLRQRREDIPTLTANILERIDAPPALISDQVHQLLRQYAWPGNLLELEGELRRLANLGKPRAAVEDVSEAVRLGRGSAHARSDYSGRTLGELEEELVRAAMRDCEGVKARAARQLGVPRSTLYHLLERYGL